MRRLLALLLLASTVCASEVQHHGLTFESWLAEAFFDGYRAPSSTDKWDIPASANTRHGSIPVNPKATQYGEPVLLGDALRQFDIDEPFWLIAGFWRQKDGDKKFVQSVAVRINPPLWRELWAPVTRADLEEMDRLVKDTAKSVEEVRREVLRRKKQPPFSQAVIQLNPKIDTRQRRLQCSISYVRLFQKLAPERSRKPVEHPEIFGRPIPDIPASPRRTLGAPSALN